MDQQDSKAVLKEFLFVESIQQVADADCGNTSEVDSPIIILPDPEDRSEGALPKVKNKLQGQMHLSPNPVSAHTYKAWLVNILISILGGHGTSTAAVRLAKMAYAKHLAQGLAHGEF